MLISRVFGKWKSVRWVTEDGHVFRFKRRLKHPNSVVMICANRKCRGTGYVKFQVPYEYNPEYGEFIVARQHSPGVNCRDTRYSEVTALRNIILYRAATENTEHSVIFQEEMSRVRSEIASQLNWNSMTTSMKRARKSAIAAAKEPQEVMGTTSFETALSTPQNNNQFEVPHYTPDSQDSKFDIPEDSTMGQTSHVPSTSSHSEEIPIQNQDIDNSKSKKKLTSTITSSDVSLTSGTSSTDVIKIKPINTLQGKHLSRKVRESKTKEVVQTSNVDISVKSLESAIKRLESVSKKLTDISMLDCYDQFGKYISSVLRGLPVKKVHSLKQKIISEVMEALAQEEMALNENVSKDIPADLTSELRANYHKKFFTERSQGANISTHSKSVGSKIPIHGNMPLLYSSLFNTSSPEVIPNAMSCEGSSVTPTSGVTIASNSLPVPEEAFLENADESLRSTSIPKLTFLTPLESDQSPIQSPRSRKRRKTIPTHTNNMTSSTTETVDHSLITSGDDSSTDGQSISFTDKRKTEEQDYEIDIEEGNELVQIKEDSDLFETVLCGESSSVYIKEEALDPEEILEENLSASTSGPASLSVTCHICNTQCGSMEDLVSHFSTTHPGCALPTIVVSGVGNFVT